MTDPLIRRDRSIIPACDVDFEQFSALIQHTHQIPGVGGYKIGAALALSVGLPLIVETARRYTTKPLIYDHQKAGTDIPDTGAHFARVLKRAGVSAIILFPLAGPSTESAWISAAQDVGLEVIVGARMTHERFLASEGGYFVDEAIDEILRIAAGKGVKHFVVPGNQPTAIAHVRQLLLSIGINPVFYAPGFITQGGEIAPAASAAGHTWHAIIGRAIYAATDIESATKSFASVIESATFAGR